MKVICRRCSSLLDEDEAIKMSYAEFTFWKQIEDNIPEVQTHESEYNRYTQVCQPCYFGNKKDSDPKPVGPPNRVVKEGEVV